METEAPETYNHRHFGLRKGGIAYLVLEPGLVNEITITGPCGDGHGYEARKAVSPGHPYASIHTCNGYLSPLLPDARREAFRQLVEEKDGLVRKIGNIQPRLASLQDEVEKGWGRVRVVPIGKGRKRR